jgi:hypothetical protein
MFFYPFYRTSNKAFIRILHASPDAPAVDVYANDKILVKDLRYKQFTEYLQVTADMYNIKVYPRGTTSKPVINTNITVGPETITTVAAVDTLSNIHLLPVNDAILPRNPNKTYIRFAHLSPNTPAVDITLPDGSVIFKNISFEEVTEYAETTPGKYTFQARPTGTNVVALTIPNIITKPNRFYTIYAVGLIGENPSLQVLIPLDGNSYIQF